MKKISRIFLLLCVYVGAAPLFNAVADSRLPFENTGPDKELVVSMDFKDADLKEVLKVFSIQSRMNFIASEAIADRKMTLYLDKVPIGKAMDEIFKANNLSYDIDKEANIFIVKEWGKLGPEMLTKVFFLKYASVSSSSIKEEMAGAGKATELGCSSSSSSGGGGGTSSGKWKSEGVSGLTETIRALLSKEGTLVEDYRTNSIIVTDVPSRLEILAQVIAELDVPIPQVLIEVEMLDVGKTTVDKLGINWPETLASLSVPGMRTTSFPFSGNKADQNKWLLAEPSYKAPANSFGAGQTAQQLEFKDFSTSHFMPSVLSILNANLALDFFKSQSDTKFLARPKILTLSGETAEVKISTNEAIGIVTNTSSVAGAGSTQAERVSTGVILRVTPQVNTETGEITMFVSPSVAVASPGLISADGTTYKDPEVRGTKSMVRVKDGETIVLGGLIKTQRQETKNNVPLVSNIPIIGALFRHTERPSDGNKDRELMVFMTPHIVGDTGMKRSGLTYAKPQKLAVSSREQSGLAGVSRQVAVGSYLNNFEKSAR